MYDLGSMYDGGRGVAQSYSEAMSWFRKAAAKGNAPAMKLVGWYYRNAYSVERER